MQYVSIIMQCCLVSLVLSTQSVLNIMQSCPFRAVGLPLKIQTSRPPVRSSSDTEVVAQPTAVETDQQLARDTHVDW